METVAINDARYPVDTHGFRYALECPFTERLKAARRHTTDVVVDGLGNLDRTGFRGRLKASRDIDSVTTKVASDNHNVGDVQTKTYMLCACAGYTGKSASSFHSGP